MVTQGNWGGGGRLGNRHYLLTLVSCQQDLKLILDAAYSLWVELTRRGHLKPPADEEYGWSQNEHRKKAELEKQN